MTRVGIVGTGLIGASIGLALRRDGVAVRGFDLDPARAQEAARRGATDDTAPDVASVAADADVVIIAVPVGHVAELVIRALDAGAPVVTDVGSVKAPIVDAVEAARPDRAAQFVGGHPMAGSEQDGVDGADPDLFVGTTWVFTPTERTDASAFSTVRRLLAPLGAEALAVTPADHDRLVAVVSHVPQLAAATRMDVATNGEAEPATLLRLAAGGFRDMTRIAAGHPAIWPDICVANRDEIVAALDGYLVALGDVRSLVAARDRAGLLALLERARAARQRLPVGPAGVEALVELRVPVPDRPAVLAEVTTLAGSMGINIADIEIVHSVEGGGGILVLLVPASDVAAFEAALTGRGYHHSRRALP